MRFTQIPLKKTISHSPPPPPFSLFPLPVLWSPVLPPRLLLPLEAARNGVYLACALAAARASPSGVTPSAFATLLTHCVVLTAASPFVFSLLAPSEPDPGLARLETCPRALRPLRDSAVAAGASLRSSMCGEAPLMDTPARVACQVLVVVQLGRSLATREPAPLTRLGGALNAAFLCAAAASLLSRGRVGAGGEGVAVRDAETATVAALRERLAAAATEDGILEAGADALASLFPGACALAMGTLLAPRGEEGNAQTSRRDSFSSAAPAAGGDDDAVVGAVVASSSHPGVQVAMRAALRAPRAASSARASVGALFAAGVELLDSATQPGGVAAFTDVRSARCRPRCLLSSALLLSFPRCENAHTHARVTD